MEILKLGIDDAGRGPVMGPMILAGALCSAKAEKEFKKLGVTDSKKLTQKRREFLEVEIKKLAKDFHVIVIPAKKIDDDNEKGINLNQVEAIACAEIINKINKGTEKMKVIIDCPSVSIEKWRDYLRTHVKNLSNLEISCEHKADKNHISVSAGSVLAKCERERQVKKLKEKYGDLIGSGYTSDPLTQKFLAKNALKLRDDCIFRKCWKTWQNAVDGLSQRTL